MYVTQQAESRSYCWANDWITSARRKTIRIALARNTMADKRANHAQACKAQFAHLHSLHWADDSTGAGRSSSLATPAILFPHTTRTPGCGYKSHSTDLVIHTPILVIRVCLYTRPAPRAVESLGTSPGTTFHLNLFYQSSSTCESIGFAPGVLIKRQDIGVHNLGTDGVEFLPVLSVHPLNQIPGEPPSGISTTAPVFFLTKRPNHSLVGSPWYLQGCGCVVLSLYDRLCFLQNCLALLNTSTGNSHNQSPFGLRHKTPPGSP